MRNDSVLCVSYKVRGEIVIHLAVKRCYCALLRASAMCDLALNIVAITTLNEVTPLSCVERLCPTLWP